MSVAMLRQRIAAALHPLQRVPCEVPWNYAELQDLLPPLESLAHAAVLVGIVAHEEPTIILTRRTQGLTHHAGQISFPGGRVDANDAGPVAAALREAGEEIGLSPDAIDALGFLDPYATITGFRVTPVVALVQPQAAYCHAPVEVDEVFEAPLEFLLDPVNVKLHAREFRGRIRQYHVFEWQGREIWGATAAMIVNLRERLIA
jgi:8-oxo-dGTP pyrophosphatase MutT (NUDIX family)